VCACVCVCVVHTGEQCKNCLATLTTVIDMLFWGRVHTCVGPRNCLSDGSSRCRHQLNMIKQSVRDIYASFVSNYLHNMLKSWSDFVTRDSKAFLFPTCIFCCCVCFGQECNGDGMKNSVRPVSFHGRCQSSTTNFDSLTKSTLDPTACLVPRSYAGFLLKSRKSPMKGWHKVIHHSG